MPILYKKLGTVRPTKGQNNLTTSEGFSKIKVNNSIRNKIDREIAKNNTLPKSKQYLSNYTGNQLNTNEFGIDRKAGLGNSTEGGAIATGAVSKNVPLGSSAWANLANTQYGSSLNSEATQPYFKTARENYANNTISTSYEGRVNNQIVRNYNKGYSQDQNYKYQPADDEIIMYYKDRSGNDVGVKYGDFVKDPNAFKQLLPAATERIMKFIKY